MSVVLLGTLADYLVASPEEKLAANLEPKFKLLRAPASNPLHLPKPLQVSQKAPNPLTLPVGNLRFPYAASWFTVNRSGQPGITVS